MTLNDPTNCPRCGSPSPPPVASKLCATCLLLQALEPEEILESDEYPVTEDFLAGESPGRNRHRRLPESAELPCDFGGYRLLRMLGSGGMGTVYEAEQASTGRRVALKMLSQQLESPDMRGRFLREGRLAAGISHPNSLYVFGTDEIEGIPVITMEIADSGTLADQLKKRGPLPVQDAVDVVLGLIDGLEAAHAVGVLHRDVKPSNIFVHRDGSVKVGDYGLSVSTVASIDSFATATGVALGTPAYAAPEQLRGDEPDVRADIYSVGATLFTLLTDRAPIEGKNPVQIVAAALDEKPKLLTAFRSDVPAGLAQIVARCLAKKPTLRPADYAELRTALLPYSSETPHPAPLPPRALAYLIDELLSWIVPGAIATAYYGVTSTAELAVVQPQFGPIIVLLLAVGYVTYYTLLEGGWGAGFGKWLTHIRVAWTSGRPPGYLRASLRAVIAWIARQGMIVLVILTMFSGMNTLQLGFRANGLLYVGFWLGLMFVPLITMRRRNGFATVWDILTGTRVIEEPKGAVRAKVDFKPLNVLPLEGVEHIGPYAIVEQIAPGWMAGIDPALHRQVLLRSRKSGDLDRSRRNLARPGRFRWQQSIKTPETTWDVFETQPGEPLTRLLNRKQQPHWEAIRHWLYDLVIEIAQASEDGTLPEQLGLDHVWITGSGRAILLDEPWPGVEQPSVEQLSQLHSSNFSQSNPKPISRPIVLTRRSQSQKNNGDNCSTLDDIDVTDIAGRQRFIDLVARCADPTTIPLHARPVLHNLATGSFEKLSYLAGNFRSLRNKPARLDPAGRAASLFAIPLVLIATAVLFGLIVQPASDRARAATLKAMYPDLPALNDVLRMRESLRREKQSLDLIDIHLSGHYNYADFSNFADYQRYRLLTEPERESLLQTIDSPRQVTPEELQDADRKLSQALPEFLLNERQSHLSTSLRALVESSLGLLSLTAFIQLVSITLLATTGGQHLFGFAVVNTHGQPSGRFRLIIRWLIAWSLFFLTFLSVIPGTGGLPLVLLLPWFIGLAVAVMRPARGLHDQLSGCWLVPR